MTVKQIQWQLWILDLYSGYIDGIAGILTNNGRTEFFEQYCNGDSSVDFDSKSMEILKKIQTKVGTTVDGLGGCLTKNAIMKLQENNGLAQTGKWDTQTKEKFPEVLDGTYTAPATSEPTNSDNFWDSIEYFTREEFRCKCGGKYCDGFPAEPSQTLVKIADEMRKEYGVPMTVSSGIRCPTHNANVGGVSNSRHLSGKAMDFCVKGKTAAQIISDLNSNRHGLRYFYAIDSNYVHMDVL